MRTHPIDSVHSMYDFPRNLWDYLQTIIVGASWTIKAAQVFILDASTRIMALAALQFVFVKKIVLADLIFS